MKKILFRGIMPALVTPLTEDEKQIILAGCLMNYWKNK